LGRLWIFSWGGGGWEEETPGERLLSRFRRTTRVSEQPFLCYILYIEQWRFRYSLFRPSPRGPRSATPWTDTCVVQVSTTGRPVPHIEDSAGTVVPRSTTDSMKEWVWCFMHMRFMLHVISVICLV
jgi:hypothetical protein